MKNAKREMNDYKFLGIGDHPLLIFSNTIVCHGASEEDHLPDVHAARIFFNRLYGYEISDTEFSPLIKLRSHLRDLFSFLVGEKTDDPRPEINAFLIKQSFHLELAEDGNIVWKGQDRVITQVLKSLELFILELAPERLKKCSNPQCSHFFYDRSKNNSRNWCSMKSCGNIMKARAFVQRKKNGP